jgi:hypothetical protein
MTFDVEKEEEEDSEDEEQEDEDNLLQLVSAVQSSAEIPAIIMVWMQQRERHRWLQSISTFSRTRRNPMLFNDRLQWDDFIQKFGGRTELKRHLRMSAESFLKLLGHIRPSLEVDPDMTGRRGGQIHPELCLYACLRFLAGGLYSDIRFFTGKF